MHVYWIIILTINFGYLNYFKSLIFRILENLTVFGYLEEWKTRKSLRKDYFHLDSYFRECDGGNW